MDILYESVILNQRIDYFVLESEYKLLQIGTNDDKKESKKKFNLKSLIVEKFKKIIDFLKFIKNKVVDFSKKIIPTLKRAVKSKIAEIKSTTLYMINKKYETVDIYQIINNIDNLVHDFKYTDFALPLYFPSKIVALKKIYSDKDGEQSIEKSTIFQDISSSIKDYEEKFSKKSYTDMRDEYCKKYVELSKIDNISIGYRDIFKVYLENSLSGSELQLLIDNIDKYIDFNEKLVAGAESIEMKNPSDDAAYLGLINRISKVSANVIKRYNEYIQDMLKNIKAFNQYFSKYLIKDHFTDDTDDTRKQIDRENKGAINRSKYTDKSNE